MLRGVLPVFAGLYFGSLFKYPYRFQSPLSSGIVQLCINTQDPYLFQSQCADCNRALFTNTVQGCTGLSTLPSNITFVQAICLIEACTAQVRNQRNTRVVNGRRRREASSRNGVVGPSAQIQTNNISPRDTPQLHIPGITSDESLLSSSSVESGTPVHNGNNSSNITSTKTVYMEAIHDAEDEIEILIES